MDDEARYCEVAIEAEIPGDKSLESLRAVAGHKFLLNFQLPLVTLDLKHSKLSNAKVLAQSLGSALNLH
jgi:hypothetical protein